MKQIISVLFAALILASCGSGKAVQGEGKGTVPATVGKQKDSNGIDFLRQVSDNAVYSKDIVSSIDFSLTAMGRDISVVSTSPYSLNPAIRSIINAENRVGAAGDKVHFALKPAKVLLFDKETEERILF